MTTIRPNILPPHYQGGPRPQDHEKLAAQREFFARALGQAQGTPAATAAAAPAAASQPVQAPARAAAAPSAEASQKVLRPGSLIDIRV